MCIRLWPWVVLQHIAEPMPPVHAIRLPSRSEAQRMHRHKQQARMLRVHQRTPGHWLHMEGELHLRMQFRNVLQQKQQPLSPMQPTHMPSRPDSRPVHRPDHQSCLCPLHQPTLRRTVCLDQRVQLHLHQRHIQQRWKVHPLRLRNTPCIAHHRLHPLQHHPLCAWPVPHAV